MFSWEQATSGFLDAIGLRTIKIRIIAFALIATLIPSLTMGWLSYWNNRRAIDEKVVQELTSMTSHASRELGLWVRERRYEMKVLSSSYEVTENLEKLNRPGQPDPGQAAALRRLKDYLRSVSEKFADYEELVVMDARGAVLAASAAPGDGSGLAGDWFQRVRANESLIGNPQWDKTHRTAVVLIAEPIRSASGIFLGAMSAKVNFHEIDGILARYAKEPSSELYLVTRAGEVLRSSKPLEGPFLSTKLSEAASKDLFEHEMTPLQFGSFRGIDVLGALRAVPEMRWGVVAEKDRAAAYAAVIRMRNVTLALISTLLLAIGLAAYLLGLTVVGPLSLLIRGANKVSSGDLDVNLPRRGHSEVAYMTEVFNDMVARLRKFRDENVAINRELIERNEELRTLSITDKLTGLYNRTQLSELLEKELGRSRRYGHSFSILMIDIDHFKRFNDAHGHQAGDELLRRVAGTLRSQIRSCDVAARYGGEEFLILLTETGPEGALSFAEKLRARVEAIRKEGGQEVTVSIGGASFPDHGDGVESIIRKADETLYECKRNGRNRVALAKTARRPIPRSRVSSG